jgi:ubiquinone/menaquinone biosynthesis C-methylase UbiE
VRAIAEVLQAKLCQILYIYKKIHSFHLTALLFCPMTAISPLDSLVNLPNPLTKAAYQAFQTGKSAFSLAHKTLATRLHEWVDPTLSDRSQVKPLPDSVLQQMRQRQAKLLEVDWQDAELGVYPPSLLFDNPWADVLGYYPAVWLDLPKIWERTQKGEIYQFPADVDLEGYPQYYRRNFHYQTDGYLSDLSANLYDLQVEILFFGLADAMRRRILKPLKQGLQAFSEELPSRMRLLDLACGTGRTLKMIRGMLPQASLFGVDLSPAYLKKANQWLAEGGDLPQLLQAPVEDLPYQDRSFHALTCVFLFHELPGPIRQQAIAEAYRVLKLNGTFIICDSIQVVDSPDLKPMMENFPRVFHEPYYTDYVNDDMDSRIREVGFEIQGIEQHFASKYWILHKPA